MKFRCTIHILICGGVFLFLPSCTPALAPDLLSPTLTHIPTMPTLKISEPTTPVIGSPTAEVPEEDRAEEELDELIWFAPNAFETQNFGLPYDVRKIFYSDAPWQETMGRIDVFQFSIDNVASGHFPMKRAVQFMKEQDIAIAVETTPISDWECSGVERAQTEVRELRRIKDEGGKIKYIVMRFPFEWTLAISRYGGCGYSVEEVASEIAKYMQLMRLSLHGAEIGLVEMVPNYSVGAYPSINPIDLGDLTEILEITLGILEEHGQSLDFFHAESVYSATQELHYYNQGWEKLAALQNFVESKGLRFGLVHGIYGATEEHYFSSPTLSRIAYQEVDPDPHHIIFQSRSPFPRRWLPEEEPGTLTYLLKQFLEIRSDYSHETEASTDVGQTQVWFGPLPPMSVYEASESDPGRPYIGSVDFMDLFDASAPWEQAAGNIDTFKLYGEWVSHWSTDSQLIQVIDDLKQRGIALGIEFGPLQRSETCGELMPEGFGGSFSLHALRRIRALGGNVRYIALDQPYFYGKKYRGPSACRWSSDKIAQEIGVFIEAAKEYFPDVIIGDTEPLGPDLRASELMDWMDTFRSVNGYDLAFLHLDMVYEMAGWSGDVQRLHEYGDEHGIGIGPIYFGDCGRSTDSSWLREAGSRVIQYEDQAGLMPDYAVIQSWCDKPDYVLPETEKFTFTNFVNLYTDDREALGK